MRESPRIASLHPPYASFGRKALLRPSSVGMASPARRRGWQISHALSKSTRGCALRPAPPWPRLAPFVNSPTVASGEVEVRRFAMVLVALLMAGGSAVADGVDPAVTARLREWSLVPPSAFRIVICHGFGCAFRT